MTLPPSFRQYRDRSRLLVVAEELESAIAELGIAEADGLERLLAAAKADGGRGRNAITALPGRKERLHLRPVLRGGWLAGLRVDRLAGPSRPLAELTANARLADAGAPVPRPALMAARRIRSGSWTAVIGTVHRENACNGLEFVAGEPTHENVCAVAEAAGVALKRFHDVGGRHADLHLGNLLVQTDGLFPAVSIVDLDRARVTGAVPPRRRMREIMRLERSALKHGVASVVNAAVQARFLEGYTAGDDALRRALLASLSRERMRIALHRMAYRRP